MSRTNFIIKQKSEQVWMNKLSQGGRVISGSVAPRKRRWRWKQYINEILRFHHFSPLFIKSLNPILGKIIFWPKFPRCALLIANFCWKIRLVLYNQINLIKKSACLFVRICALISRMQKKKYILPSKIIYSVTRKKSGVVENCNAKFYCYHIPSYFHWNSYSIVKGKCRKIIFIQV